MTDPSGLRIEPATAADIEQVLPLHEAAFAGTMGVSLGRAYLRRFLGSFLDRPGRVFLVARSDTGVVGYVFGRSVGESSSDDRALLPHVAAGLLRHPGTLLRADVRGELVRRARSVGRPSPPDPTLPAPVRSLVGIGTDPARRGEGIGRALVTAFQDRAAADGFASTRLSVYRDNEPARRLYERCGWHPLDHPTNPAVLFYAWSPADGRVTRAD